MSYLAKLASTNWMNWIPMERAGMLGRTKVLAAMLHLDIFGTAELADRAMVAVSVVNGVIATMPDDALESVPTPREYPLRYRLSQREFFKVQGELATLTDSPELLPFSRGQEIPLLLSCAKTYLMCLDSESRVNDAVAHHRIAANLDAVELALAAAPITEWSSRYLMGVDLARTELECHIRKLLMS